jgi:predicted transcriptional regulator
MKDILWYVFVGSRGGETRMKIVQSIAKHPKNAHELTKELAVDYSTVRHSLKVLEKNRLVCCGGGYGVKYDLTPEFKSMLREYDILVECYHTASNCTQRKWEKLLKREKEA